MKAIAKQWLDYAPCELWFGTEMSDERYLVNGVKITLIQLYNLILMLQCL